MSCEKSEVVLQPSYYPNLCSFQISTLNIRNEYHIICLRGGSNGKQNRKYHYPDSRRYGIQRLQHLQGFAPVLLGESARNYSRGPANRAQPWWDMHWSLRPGPGPFTLPSTGRSRPCRGYMESNCLSQSSPETSSLNCFSRCYLTILHAIKPSLLIACAKQSWQGRNIGKPLSCTVRRVIVMAQPSVHLVPSTRVFCPVLISANFSCLLSRDS